jgi:hypothetical protein
MLTTAKLVDIYLRESHTGIRNYLQFKFELDKEFNGQKVIFDNIATNLQSQKLYKFDMAKLDLKDIESIKKCLNSLFDMRFVLQIQESTFENIVYPKVVDCFIL